jgi:phosphopentomutase
VVALVLDAVKAEATTGEPSSSKVRVKFGTAGIRGTYGQEVTIREAIAVCFAVNRLLGRGRFGVGYDTRITSLVLANVACSAMNWYGSDVDDYGVIPTPVLAFTIKRSKLHAGFSVTASHNPPEFAGVKVFGIDGIEFSVEDERKLEHLVQESEEFTKPQEELGSFGSTFENEEAILYYKEALVSRSRETKKRFKIVVDCANGTACNVTPDVLRELGHQVVTVNSHPSANFPGRLPEPMSDTLVEVATLAKSIGADFAIAHDGDADRLVMIDDLGRVVPDHDLSALALKVIVGSGRKGNVIISVNSSSAVEKVAEQLGCRVQRSRLGKTFGELYKRRGIFASEPSKMVDPRWGYWEDGIYTSVLISQYLSTEGIRLSELLQSIPRYYNLQANVSMSSPLDYGCVKSAFKEAFGPEVDKFDELDGVKMYLRNGSWVMLRSSGTEKKARIYAESKLERESMSLIDRARKIAVSCGA